MKLYVNRTNTRLYNTLVIGVYERRVLAQNFNVGKKPRKGGVLVCVYRFRVSSVKLCNISRIHIITYTRRR